MLLFVNLGTSEYVVSGSLVLSASVGAKASMFRGRAIDKGRIAVSAPLALGVMVQFDHR